MANVEASSRSHNRVGRDEQGLEASRLYLRGLNDLLCLHAGRGHGERPHGGLFPARANQEDALSVCDSLTVNLNSPDELLAVVNARNEEVGAETRRRVHDDKLLHRAVHVLLLDRDGRLIIQQRSNAKETHALKW